MKLFLFISCYLFFDYAYSQSDSISLNIDNKKINPATLLWYNKPAAKWEEALPVGNGRLGAMVFGKTNEERIQLNEDTYWTGGPYSTVKKDGYKSLPEIQKLVFEGKSIQAHNLFGRTMMGYPVEQQKYQSLADLYLSFLNHDKFTDYKRWLDLETAITGCEYRCNGIKYRREIFSSAPGQVIAIRITADHPSSISFTAQLRGVRNQAHSNYGTDYFQMDAMGDDQLVLTGKSADYLGIEGKLRYEARLKVVAEGGKVHTGDAKLIVEAADAVTLYFTAATNFINYKNVSGDQHALIQKYLNGIEEKNFNSLLKAHLEDYQSYLNGFHYNYL